MHVGTTFWSCLFYTLFLTSGHLHTFSTSHCLLLSHWVQLLLLVCNESNEMTNLLHKGPFSREDATYLGATSLKILTTSRVMFNSSVKNWRLRVQWSFQSDMTIWCESGIIFKYYPKAVLPYRHSVCSALYPPHPNFALTWIDVNFKIAWEYWFVSLTHGFRIV